MSCRRSCLVVGEIVALVLPFPAGGYCFHNVVSGREWSISAAWRKHLNFAVLRLECTLVFCPTIFCVLPWCWSLVCKCSSVHVWRLRNCYSSYLDVCHSVLRSDSAKHFWFKWFFSCSVMFESLSVVLPNSFLSFQYNLNKNQIQTCLLFWQWAKNITLYVSSTTNK